MEKINSKIQWVLFPAITMLLGWGLRGYIGGGPFGAMIPGAMVALCLALLLQLSVEATSVLVAFAAIGVGIGGEMTYGQTLGFLRNPETVLWGSLGTTVKGAMWGLLGGIIIALGFIHKKLKKKQVVFALLLLLAGMFTGFKLINQPMLIYFSDPAKPRPESWAALLFGALFLYLYLRKISDNQLIFIINKFAIYGFTGGAIGFGLGSQWMTLGNFLPTDLIFKHWWKSMEFSFGFLLGGGYGLAAWSCRHVISEIKSAEDHKTTFKPAPFWQDGIISLILILLIFWILPSLFDPIVDNNYVQGKFVFPNYVDLVKIISNYAFYGLIVIVVVLWFPKMAWQAGITLTFCYTAIDLMQDIYPDFKALSPVSGYFFFIFLMILMVWGLTRFMQSTGNMVRNMLLLLIWSCMAVAFLRLGLLEKSSDNGIGFLSELIYGRYWVHTVFMASAVYSSWVAFKKFTV